MKYNDRLLNILKTIYKILANKLFAFWMKHEVCITIFLILIFVAMYFISPKHIDIANKFDSLSSITGNIGPALIGISVIAIPLIVFALQINIQRMPYLFFSILHNDQKMISAYKALFLFAIFFTATPILVWNNLSANLIFTLDIFIIIGIFFLIFKIYHRALDLINPSEQLLLLEKQAEKSLKQWHQAIVSGMSEFGIKQDNLPDASFFNTAFSEENFKCFNEQLYKHKNLIDELKWAIWYAMFFVRENVKKEDYQIAQKALDAILHIEKMYLETLSILLIAKYPSVRTVAFDTGEIIECALQEINWYITDIMNNKVRRDRQTTKEISQIFQFMESFIQISLDTEFLLASKCKIYSLIISEKLKQIVRQIAAIKVERLLIEAQQIFGSLAQKFLAKDDLFQTKGLAEEIFLISQDGYKDNRFQQFGNGLRELEKVVSILLRYNPSPPYSFKDLHDSILDICENIAEIANLEWSENRSIFYRLPSYYGEPKTPHSFLAHLNEITSMISDYNNQSQFLIRNLCYWSESLFFQTKQNSFLRNILSNENKSKLVPDYEAPLIALWVIEVISIFLRVSTKILKEDILSKESLAKSIDELLKILEEIPDREDINSKALDALRQNLLFSILIESSKINMPTYTNRILQIYLDWIFRYRQENTKLKLPESGLIAIATFSILDINFNMSILKEWLEKNVYQASLLSIFCSDYRMVNKTLTELANNPQKNRKLENVKQKYIKKYQVDAKQMDSQLLKIAKLFPLQDEIK